MASHGSRAQAQESPETFEDLRRTEVFHEESVPVHSRIWVSAADGATAILCSIAEGAALTYYFTRVMGLAPRLASIVWLLFGIWNAFNDPLFGYISDRTRSRLGRRIPYIRYGAPLYAAAFAIFWIVLPGFKGNQTALFIQMLLGMFLFDAFYTAIATAVYIMPYEMAVSNKARSSIFVWKIGFSLIATAFPIAIGLIQPGPGQDATPYRLIMVGLGILMAVVIYASTFFYEENHFQQEEEQFNFWKSLGACFHNKSFVVFESISFTVIYVQNQLMQGIYYYYDEVSMGVAKSTGGRPHPWLALCRGSPWPAAVPQPSRCLGRETLCPRVCFHVRHRVRRRSPVSSPARSDDDRLSVNRRGFCRWHVPHSTYEW